MRIAVLTPSRARPDRFAEMVQAIRDTADGPVDVYLATDAEDIVYPYIDGVRCVRGPRQRLSGWTNDLARWALEDGADIIGSFGDDHRPRTAGWDARVRDAFDAMGAGLVYTADGLQDERLPTAPFWSASIIRELGWFFPPPLVHLYADNTWLQLATDLGRRTYLPDVLIEHLHPSAGKATADEVNRQNDSHCETDRVAFEAFIASGEYQDCVRRVRAIL